MSIVRSALLALVLLLAAAAQASAETAPEQESCAVEPAVPGFAIEVAGEGFSAFQPRESPVVIDGDVVRVRLSRAGSGEWVLHVEAKEKLVRTVRFPWKTLEPRRKDPGTVYLGRFLGVAMKVENLRGPRRHGCRYPGHCFSPLAVYEGTERARLLAGANWPPRRSSVVAVEAGAGVEYVDVIPAHDERSYRALSVEACGKDAWYRVSAVYREWLEARMERAELLPIQQPDWLRHGQGWLSLHLQGAPRFDVERLEDRWRRARSLVDRIQFWGQMSNYGGMPSMARPPLRAGEATGCCLVRTGLHPRYRKELPDFIRRVAKDARVGLFARAGPEPLFDPQGRETPAMERLRSWIESNKEIGANAIYIDVLGGKDLGDMMKIARFLQEPAVHGAVIEAQIDIYPAAYLASGSLDNPVWRGGPRARLARGQVGGIAFPRLGRSILRDRIIFLGEQNNGHETWGVDADYWGPRHAFLLGAKLDVIHFDHRGGFGKELADILDEIVAERRRVDWWKREPVYLDRSGLGPLPEGIDVRRFRGRDGADLLVVDNWEGRSSLTVEVEGRKVLIPEDRLSIAIVEDDAS